MNAIDFGYRHFDCGAIFGNEREIGKAIQTKINERVVTRSDLFISGKIWNSFNNSAMVEAVLNQTLSELDLCYLDLLLLHIPHNVTDKADYVDTWKEMEIVLKKTAQVRMIGVSNFDQKDLERLIALTSTVPVINQVECHPYLSQKSLIKFCEDNGIAVAAFSPFGSPQRPWATQQDHNLLKDPILASIAERYNKTIAQTILRYLTQRGLIVTPKSVHSDRIRENINIFDFYLSIEDMVFIDGLDRNETFISRDWKGTGSCIDDKF